MIRFPDQYRIRSGPLASPDGGEGAFAFLIGKARVAAIASHSLGWEHVSVSMADRCLTWDEMCAVKALFWDPEDAVVQYHPPQSMYVNHHPYCLHLWRPLQAELPLPPEWMVGPTAKPARA